MKKQIKFKKNLIFKRMLFLMMLVIAFYIIFNFSAQDGQSSGLISRNLTEFIVEIISKLKTIDFELKLQYIEKLHPIIRKLAHFSIYTFVGFSIMGFMCTFDVRNIFKVIISFDVGVTYAISDEVHQYFIPGRGPSIIDVGIDSLGVLTGIFLLVILILFTENICNYLRDRNMKEKVLTIMKNKKRYILLFLCLILFCIILTNVLNGKIQNFDSNIYSLIRSIASKSMDTFFRIITRFGDEEVLILIAISCLIFIKNRKIGGSIVINLAGIGLINYLLKEMIQRPRPPIELKMVEESSFSFPSGHAMASVAFYGLFIYYIYKYVKNKTIKNIVCTILSVLIFLVGVSRIYLGVHYASDVLAGYLFSIVYLIIYIMFVLKLFKIKEN